MPIILATWKAEIWRIAVLGAKNLVSPLFTIQKNGMMTYACHHRYGGSIKVKAVCPEQPTKNETICPKYLEEGRMKEND
jgi:hypothetical protein